MRLFTKNPLLRPKNVTFCPGCPNKDLQLNKEFNFEIPTNTVNAVNAPKPRVSLVSDKLNKNSNKNQTLF